MFILAYLHIIQWQTKQIETKRSKKIRNKGKR